MQPICTATDTSPEAIIWRNSGLNPDSRWKNLVQFVETNGSFQQSGSTLIPKLLIKLPVTSTFFQFEYHSNGKAIASRITPTTPKDGTPTDTKLVPSSTDTNEDISEAQNNNESNSKDHDSITSDNVSSTKSVNDIKVEEVLQNKKEINTDEINFKRPKILI